jgi:hypothetical protein
MASLIIHGPKERLGLHVPYRSRGFFLLAVRSVQYQAVTKQKVVVRLQPQPLPKSPIRENIRIQTAVRHDDEWLAKLAGAPGRPYGVVPVKQVNENDVGRLYQLSQLSGCPLRN